MPEARPDYVQSLERGLAVLTSFSGETPALTLSDVARRTGLTRATARRLLLTLEELGYVGSDGRLFHLRPKTLDIGYAYLSSLPVAEIAVPYMEELSTALHESSSAAILDGEDIVYIARVPAIADRVQLAEIEFVLQAKLDRGCGARNLTGNKGLAAGWPLMVEQDPV